MGDLPPLTTGQTDADPHGVFRLWRATPVVAHEAGRYVVLCYINVERLRQDPRLRATEADFPRMLGIREGTLSDIFEQGMLTVSNEVHRRHRSSLFRTFAARTIAELRPGTRRAAEELIDAWYADGQVEFVGQSAAQIPACVIRALSG